MPQLRTCRLCLYRGDEKQIMPIWENQVEDLATKIFNCVAIRVAKDDDLPMSACLSCIHQITQWEMFRTTCQKSNEILTEKLKNRLNVGLEIFMDLNDEHEKESNSLKLNKSLLIQTEEETLTDEEAEEDDEELEEGEEVKNMDILESELLNFNFKSEDFTENIYECEFCLATFDTCFSYLDHQQEHNGEKVFQCDKCPEIFNMRNLLVDHDRKHTEPCDLCGKMVLKTSMKLHLIKHTDKFKCKQCNIHCNSNAALNQHTSIAHTKLKNHICEQCGKRFSSQAAIKVHVKSHSDERLYRCKDCNYAGRTASALYIHRSTHATDVCVCPTCSKLFKSTRNLNDHMRRAHSKEKKHHCTYCDRKFVYKYILLAHLRCHTGVRPYTCNICDKSFIRSDGLKEHMRTHGQRVLSECKNCGKKFVSRGGVIKHSCTAA